MFISNFRKEALERLGLGPARMHEQHPHLVICVMTGRGFDGPQAHKPTYDIAGFWALSGAAHTHTAKTKRGKELQKGNPPILAPGFGDLTPGLAAVGGVTSALFQRARTGKGRVLTTRSARPSVRPSFRSRI